MKKNSNLVAKLLLATIILTAGMGLTAYAGEWQQDETGFRYQNDNGTYTANDWQWIEGNCFYFDENGYSLRNTTTPDGYQVGSYGAWIVDGVVQYPNYNSDIDVSSYGYTNGVSNIAIEMITANRSDLVAKYGEETIVNDDGRGDRTYRYQKLPFEMKYGIPYPYQYENQMDNVQNGVEVKNLGGEVTVMGSPCDMVEGLTKNNLTVKEMQDYLRPYGYIKTNISLFNNLEQHYALDYGNWDYPGYEILIFNIY